MAEAGSEPKGLGIFLSVASFVLALPARQYLIRTYDSRNTPYAKFGDLILVTRCCPRLARLRVQRSSKSTSQAQFKLLM